MAGTPAGVVEWYTRATQNRVPQGLWVQVPSPAPYKILPRICAVLILMVPESKQTALLADGT